MTNIIIAQSYYNQHGCIGCRRCVSHPGCFVSVTLCLCSSFVSLYCCFVSRNNCASLPDRLTSLYGCFASNCDVF